ncbi:hypothetical protein [Bradyrhizobium iriomotense]|uniref:hypothetical protein n=1 Tax=Bradyrhizobium iriomotense TaxID=441950 RepID=UPI0024E15194|nr:hypothetical protein [Bradyrhizobium iriomotense]
MSHLSGCVIAPNVTHVPFALLNGIAALRTGLLLFATSIDGGIAGPVTDRNPVLADGRQQ